MSNEKKDERGAADASNSGAGGSGNSAQLWVIAVFVVLGVVGVRSAMKKAGPAKKPWRPIVNIKFQTDRELALTAPQGTSAVDKMLRKHQAKAKELSKKPGNWVLLGHAWVRKARTASQEMYYKNAEACARIALKINPDYRMAQNLQSLVYLQQHKFRKARDLARKILRKRRDDAMAWGNLSDALLELGEYKQAEVAAQMMMNIKPNLPSYIRAAYLLWLRGQFYEARTTIKHAYDAGRGQKDREPVAWVLTQGALFHWHEGDLDGANAGFDVAFRYKSGYPPAVVGKAQVAMARGRYKLAVDLLAQALKDRALASTAWLLGDAKAALGDKAGAEKAYKLVESIGRREDYRTLALFYAVKKRKLSDAMLFAGREFLKRQDIYTEDAYAWVLYRNGKAKEAKAHALRAIRLGTRDARLWFHAGAILAAAGDKKRGHELIQKALSLNPHFNTDEVAEAKAMLKQAGVAIPTWGQLTRLKPPKASTLDPDGKGPLPKTFKVLRKPNTKGYKVGKIILPTKARKPKAPVAQPKAPAQPTARNAPRAAAPPARPAAPKVPKAPAKAPGARAAKPATPRQKAAPRPSTRPTK